MVESKDTILMGTLNEFYKDPRRFIALINILKPSKKTGKNVVISLRIIDFFITNYAKRYNIMIRRGNRNLYFDVYNNYKSQLKGHSKKYFDSFCRGERVTMEYQLNDDKKKHELITTIGQLNFFKWMISNGLIIYIRKHYDEILTDMNTNNGDDVSTQSLKSTVKHNVKLTVSFNRGFTGNTKPPEAPKKEPVKKVKPVKKTKAQPKRKTLKKDPKK